jgi:hypothetical protein
VRDDGVAPVLVALHRLNLALHVGSARHQDAGPGLGWNLALTIVAHLGQGATTLRNATVNYDPPIWAEWGWLAPLKNLPARNRGRWRSSEVARGHPCGGNY